MMVTYAFTGSRPPRHAERERHVLVQREIDAAGRACGGGLLDQHRQPPDRLRADDDVGHARRRVRSSASPSCCATQPATATIGSWPCSVGQLAQLAEPRVQLLLGALTDAARVDDDDVGVGGVLGRLEASLLEQPRHALGVVHVHLAAERLDEVLAGHQLLCVLRCGFSSSTTFAFALSLSPFDFDSPVRRRCRLRSAGLSARRRPPRGRCRRERLTTVKHFPGRRPETLGDRFPTEHPRELVDAARLVEPGHPRHASGPPSTRFSIR